MTSDGADPDGPPRGDGSVLQAISNEMVRRAFISGIDTEAGGLATETFVLYPSGSAGPSRIADAEPEPASPDG